MWRWFKILFLIGGVVMAAGLGYVYYRARASLPPSEGSFQVTGLTAPVEVLRDIYGIPHVYGATLPDVAQAVGYVHAQDRLFQMELARRMGAGRLAELFGEVALDKDRQVARLGLARAAREELSRMDAEARGLLEAYAAGVNNYVNGNASRLPPEFQLLRFRPAPWSPEDSLVIGKSLTYVLSYNASAELVRAQLAEKFGTDAAYRLTGIDPQALLPAPGESPTTSALVFPSLPAFQAFPAFPQGSPLGVRPGGGASNAWVVAGSRSQSGKPILASDPHLSLTLPSIWYQIHLSGGGLEVAGASLPGLPVVLIGHNDRIAWGITALFADVQDHYVEQLNPSNPKEYGSGEIWEPLQISQESIPVKGRAPVVVEIQSTRHGVVVYDAPRDGKVLALRWSGLWQGDGVLSFLRVNRAGSWTEFTDALRSLAGPPLSFVYADVEGNIGFFPAGEFPVRTAHDGTLPADGASSAFEWQASLPHESKPSTFNPETGYLVSANHTMTGPEHVGSFGRDALAPFRAKRIEALLLAGGAKLTPADFERIQSDRYDGSTASVLRELVALTPEPGAAAAAQQLLRGWDGQMRASAAAAVYEACYLQILENTFKDDLGGELYKEFLNFTELGYGGGVFAVIDDPKAVWWDDRGTPAVEDRTAILRKSLSGAAQILETRQGRDPVQWNWATLHAVSFEHPLGRVHPLDWLLNRGPVPFGGSTFTIANAIVSVEKPFGVVGGSSFRMVVDLADPKNATTIIPTGASGHVLSRHYFDQNEAWVAGKSHPLLFDRQRIENSLESRITLRP